MRRSIAMLAVSSALAGCQAAAPGTPAAPGAASPAAVTTHPVGDRAPRTVVDPLALPHGAPPRVPFYDLAAGVLHDGSRRVAVRLPGTVVQVARVAGGYVLVSAAGGSSDRDTVRFVSPRGRSRVLLRDRFTGLAAVLPGGRELVAYRGNPHVRLAVLRLRDGRVLHARGFRSPVTAVVAAGRTRALVRTGRRTVSWTYATGASVRVAADPAESGWLGAGGVGWLGLGRGWDEQPSYVVGVPAGRPAWSMAGLERVGAFGPGGRRVLTTRPFHYPEGFREETPGYAAVTLRDARNGHPLRVLAGHVDEAQDGPRWESRTTVLVLAREPHPRAGSRRVAWVRCTVGGRCVDVSPVFTLDLDHPPYGRVPWVLAGGPAG